MGTDVHIPQSVRTPSHEACQLNEVECAEILLKYEANINSFTSGLSNGSIACTELLLKMGTDVHIPQSVRTPSHEACQLNEVECAEILLKYEANGRFPIEVPGAEVVPIN
ncbi:hypothetical protein CDAR_471301 [Caerostris darwini]|uniref:Uncharacterized protein n=1 Tax=Caerostris darwini TaxID=1538125 RepID=A0AAV4RKP6_9ARAC|nr:hypothetical protein CDAR_471301 [Caerostris darwini]